VKGLSCNISFLPCSSWCGKCHSGLDDAATFHAASCVYGFTTLSMMPRLCLCRGNNEEFLSRTLKYAQRKKWSHLLAAYKAALAKLKLDQPAQAAAALAAADGSADSPAQQVELTSAVAAAEAAGGGGRGRAGSKGKAAGAVGSKPSKKRRVAASAAAAPPAVHEESEPPSDPASSHVTASGASNASNRGPSTALPGDLLKDWRRFARDVAAAERATAAAEGGFAFAFVEGALVKALKQGWWLLLDEINLAPPEVLERIAGILEVHSGAAAAAGAGSSMTGNSVEGDASTGLLLVERGDVKVISRHPGFRLVAAMNPATDAGKRDLPPQLRSRFTEFWVGEPRSRQDLGQLVSGYLSGASPSPPVEPVVDLYLAAKAQAVRFYRNVLTSMAVNVLPALYFHVSCVCVCSVWA
jgi:midasin